MFGSHSHVSRGLLHTSKKTGIAFQALNNTVLPFFDKYASADATNLSYEGRSYCWRRDQLPYALFQQIEDWTNNVRRPQRNGIIGRLHRALLDEHFCLEGREKFFQSVSELKADLNAYFVVYNMKRPHQGRGLYDTAPLREYQKGVKIRPRTAPKEMPKVADQTGTHARTSFRRLWSPYRLPSCEPRNMYTALRSAC